MTKSKKMMSPTPMMPTIVSNMIYNLSNMRMNRTHKEKKRRIRQI